MMKIAKLYNLLTNIILASVFALPFGALALEPALAQEIFTESWSGHPMSIQTSEYKFALSKGEDSYLVSASGPGGSSIQRDLNSADFQTSERLFILDSHACDSSTVDLVIQLGPSINGEGLVRRYYRIVFPLDLSSVVTEFYDPSISASNAVLPLQTVEGLVDEETGESIVCSGSLPIVVVSKDKN